MHQHQHPRIIHLGRADQQHQRFQGTIQSVESGRGTVRRSTTLATTQSGRSGPRRAVLDSGRARSLPQCRTSRRKRVGGTRGTRSQYRTWYS
eukprot:323149-Rhodomonas_salina.5